MKVVYGVSHKGNVICIIQIRELIIAQWEADTRDILWSNQLHGRTEPGRERNPVWHLMW